MLLIHGETMKAYVTFTLLVISKAAARLAFRLNKTAEETEEEGPEAEINPDEEGPEPEKAE